jgi:cysteine-rich repeat protein
VGTFLVQEDLTMRHATPILIVCSTLLMSCEGAPPAEPAAPAEPARPTEPAPGLCGDGVLDTGEECDDANHGNEDGCTAECRAARCGDGITRADLAPEDPAFEACDDGNGHDADLCLPSCGLSSCGDAIVQFVLGEQCDDGNDASGDGCEPSCVLTNALPCEHGTFECEGHTLVTCPDGVEIRLECGVFACDPLGFCGDCGDGFRDTDREQCDDGDNADGDGCSAACILEYCGDGTLNDAGREECDDGNAIEGDGCDTNCTLPGCGNQIVDDGEECDDGNNVEGDGCDTNCTASGCGNGIVAAAEICLLEKRVLPVAMQPRSLMAADANADGITTSSPWAVCFLPPETLRCFRAPSTTPSGLA